jgi:hypothetical protein
MRNGLRVNSAGLAPQRPLTTVQALHKARSAICGEACTKVMELHCWGSTTAKKVR